MSFGIGLPIEKKAPFDAPFLWLLDEALSSVDPSFADAAAPLVADEV